MTSKNLKIIVILSIINILLSGYLTYIKYSGNESICDFSKEVSCDTVSESPYSEFPVNSGIPVSVLGIIAFLIFLVPSILLIKNKQSPVLGFSVKTIYTLMFIFAIFSILFYIYLTYLELYLIYSICPVCIATFIVTIIVFIITLINFRGVRE